MTSVEWPRGSGRVYTCERYPAYGCTGVVRVTAKPGATLQVAVAGESGALRWLSDHSLKKSKANQLLAAVLRGTGPLAVDPQIIPPIAPCHDASGEASLPFPASGR